MGNKNPGFRAWFYFRQGWSTYFAFIFAAVNTLTVTYYLAIENYPSLKLIFPSFEQYILIVVMVGIPLLIFIGYIHFKRTPSYRSEAEITYESNPYGRRIFVNSELNVQLNLELMELILKISKGTKLSEDDLSRINSIKDELKEFTNERTLRNKKDLEFMKKNEDM